MQSDKKQPNRRHFIRSTVGLAAAAGAASCGGVKNEGSPGATGTKGDLLPGGVDRADFIVYNEDTPWTFETKRSELRGTITPTEKIFVRGNLPFPDASIVENADAWSLNIEGVKNPRSMTLGELKGLGATTIAAVLQCSGNGRKFFEHGPSGSPWGVGAAANVLWTGVPLSAVIEELGGLADGSLGFITGTGGEAIPEGLDRNTIVVERSIPMAKAMGDAILAWDLNSEPISLAHGGPLRLIVPGFYGVNNVKYLSRLAVTAEESPAKIQAKGYRVRPIGEGGAPNQPSMWDMNVKSWITGPLGGAAAKAGRHVVTCVAFSGQAPIQGVEITTDGGKTWNEATRSGPTLGDYAWTEFSYAWDAAPGEHLLASRARDGAGNVQPEVRAENERGYAHNGWLDPGVKMTVA